MFRNIAIPFALPSMFFTCLYVFLPVAELWQLQFRCRCLDSVYRERYLAFKSVFPFHCLKQSSYTQISSGTKQHFMLCSLLEAFSSYKYVLSLGPSSTNKCRHPTHIRRLSAVISMSFLLGPSFSISLSFFVHKLFTFLMVESKCITREV